jgi:hypothetical protein
MKKVLILTARFEETQNAAARNIAEALDANAMEAGVEVVDLFEPASGSLKSIAQRA